MEQNDIIREIASIELPCMRCAKSMALERLYYAVDQICSVGYKCLSCGYEETRPQKAEPSAG